MFRVLFVLPLFACTVQPLNQTEKTPEEENLYPDGFQFGDLVIDPGSVDFGNVELDATKTEELVFINTGSSPLSIVSASIDGDSAFTLESSFLNFDLEPEAEEVVSVRFTPIQDTSYEASLSVLISTESSAGEVSLVGLGGDAQGSEPSGEPSEEPSEGGLELDKTSHNFGQISLDSTATLVINVSNPTEENIAITGVSSSDVSFDISPYSNVQDGESISAGITRTMTINFTPTEEIMYEGVITLETDSAESPEINIDLSGEGIYQCQICTARLLVNGQTSNPLVINQPFGSVSPLSNPLSTAITITNGGDEPLEISAITMLNDTGVPDATNCGTDGNFTITNTINAPMTLEAYNTSNNTASEEVLNIEYYYEGSSNFCLENQFFNPSKLVIQSNDPNNPTFEIFFEANVLGFGILE